MADPIGLTLAAFASLDPAYTQVRRVWNGCRAAGEFGVVFNRFASRVKAQESLLLASARKYYIHLSGDRVATRWVNYSLRGTIETQLIEIVTVFEECYKLANSYHIRDVEVIGSQSSAAPITLISGLNESQAEENREFSSGSKFREAVLGFFSKKNSKKAAKGKTADTAKIQIGAARNANSNIAASQSTDDFLSTSAATMLKRRRENAQRDLSGRKAIAFADHDRVQMEQFLDRLNDMNGELIRLVELPELSLEDPLFKIRNGADPPTLWQDSETIRNDLYSLKEALSITNSEDKSSDIRLAIQLEDNHASVVNWVRGNQLDVKLKTRLVPSFFRLMAISPAEEPKHELLIAGTISLSRQEEIQDGELPARFNAALKSPTGAGRGRKYQDIGDLKLDNQRMFNIRLIVDSSKPKWFGSQSLEDIVEKDWIEFSYVNRIRLATRIALSHIHFATANTGFVPRQAKNYRFFQQQWEPSTAQDWIRPWLDNDFGSMTQPEAGGIELHSQEDIEAKRVNAAKELGRLLYQITSGYKLNPDLADELDSTCEDLLDEVLKKCGLDVKLIVKACFCSLMQKPGQRDQAYVIVEEVAYALQRLVAGLARRETAEAAMEAALAAGEAEAVGEAVAEEKDTETPIQVVSSRAVKDLVPPISKTAPAIIPTPDVQRRTQQPALAAAVIPNHTTKPVTPLANHGYTKPQAQKGSHHVEKPLTFPNTPKHEPQMSMAKEASPNGQKIAVAS